MKKYYLKKRLNENSFDLNNGFSIINGIETIKQYYNMSSEHQTLLSTLIDAWVELKKNTDDHKTPDVKNNGGTVSVIKEK